jgi:hypothetical protein
VGGERGVEVLSSGVVLPYNLLGIFTHGSAADRKEHKAPEVLRRRGGWATSIVCPNPVLTQGIAATPSVFSALNEAVHLALILHCIARVLVTTLLFIFVSIYLRNLLGTNHAQRA